MSNRNRGRIICNGRRMFPNSVKEHMSRLKDGDRGYILRALYWACSLSDPEQLYYSFMSIPGS